MAEKNVGAVIVTFNPNANAVVKLVNNLLEQVESVVIVDNGSKNVDAFEKQVEKKSVHLNKLGKNFGIAKALNIGINRLENMGIEWAVTFDQDSMPPQDYVRNFESLKRDGSEGIVGCYYIDRNWSDQERLDQEKQFKTYDESKYVITSGAFVNIATWRKVHGFDEGLFIDWVDWDFNERLFMSCYKAVRTNRLILDHEVGEVVQRPKWLRTLFLINNRPIRDHSAFRQYYIFRNRIIYLKRYENVGNVKAFVKSIVALREVVLLPHPISKLRSSLAGIVDGMKYKKSEDTFFNSFLRDNAKGVR